MHLNCYFKLLSPTRETQYFRNRALKQNLQAPPRIAGICPFLMCWSQFTCTFSVTAALGQSPGVWDRIVRSPGTCCPLQARWGWLKSLAAWLESASLCRNPLTWQTATTDQSRLKSQRVFEVKSPDVQILAYSITCPSNINSLHQEYTYAVPQLTASHAGNFSWDKCKPLHPGCCCSCRRR